MKKLLVLLVLILLVGCSLEYPPKNSSEDYRPLPKTKTVCDLLGAGLFAESTIAEQLELGYEFTGSTKGMICVNVLHFQLIEKED